MPNPLYSALGGGNQNPMIQQFTQFMNQMKGRAAKQIINEMVYSGKHSQEKLEQVQKQAQQMQGMFNSVRGMLK